MVAHAHTHTKQHSRAGGGSCCWPVYAVRIITRAPHIFCNFTFHPKKIKTIVHREGLLQETFASMATETTQSGASNGAEDLCLLCEGRFSPGEVYRMFFWSRQGKQQQLCTSSWGGMHSCSCVCVCVVFTLQVVRACEGWVWSRC